MKERLPVKVIFDTDIAPDYDDVGALAILHAMADKGEAEILATISSNSYQTTGPALSVINTYFNRPDLPVGGYIWDQTAVLAGARGISPFFNCKKTDLRIDSDGKMMVMDGDRINYLTTNPYTYELNDIFEDLMMYVPGIK